MATARMRWPFARRIRERLEQRRHHGRRDGLKAVVYVPADPGFEPFDREALQPFLGGRARARRLALRGRRGACAPHPVRLRRRDASARRGHRELQPQLVWVGQAGGRSEITPERVAINVDDGRIGDNAGHQPIDLPVVAGATGGVFLDPADQGHGARPARGRRSRRGVEQRRHLRVQSPLLRPDAPLATRPVAGVRGGFIHIPYLPEQAARLPGAPSMALATLIAGLRIAVATALAVAEDVRETAAGCTDFRARRAGSAARGPAWR